VQTGDAASLALSRQVEWVSNPVQQGSPSTTLLGQAFSGSDPQQMPRPWLSQTQSIDHSQLSMWQLVWQA
jgi:hypothetical protein